MSFDSSRFTFDPWKDFLGTVMQQGRVQVDADWNDWLAQINRRIQAGSLDTFGRAVVPKTTPEGFHITIGTDPGGNPILNIGPGRIYVDGLLAENHGLPVPLSGGWTPPDPVAPGPPPAGLGWDTALAELVGKNPVPINQQPYLPNATMPPGPGPYLVFVDVWQREITYLQDPDLVEKAVGVDTTGRLQTVWQVKYLDVSADGAVDCASDIPGYDALLLPPGAQLTTGVVQSSQSGPCCLAPNTGYTGLENQLYRVEIHQKGGLGPGGATFKWSRDDASVATGVISIAQGGTSLVVQSLGRDDVLRFNANDWVEVTDDWLDLQGLPGEIHQIKTTGPASTITLYTPVSTVTFPVDANGNTDPARHTIVRRWDQKGKVLKTDGTIWVDLDLPGATGDIQVPPAGTTLVLEQGVTVTFGLDTAGLNFQTGQFWTFAARSTDGTVEFLDSAPPRGIHHHYARLSVVTLPDTASDCRTMWPPDSSAGGDTCCCCSVDVKPEDLTGDVTLQSIFDRFQNQSSITTICLAAGTYNLPAPLRLNRAHRGIVIETCEPGTVILTAAAGSENQFADGLVVLDTASQITFSGIVFDIPFARFGKNGFAGLDAEAFGSGLSAALQELVVGFGIRVVNARRLTVQDCRFRWGAVTGKAIPFGAGIFATGEVVNLNLQRNIFTGGSDFLAGYLQAPWAQFHAPAGSALNRAVPVRRTAAANTPASSGPIPAMLSRIDTLSNTGGVQPAASPAPAAASASSKLVATKATSAIDRLLQPALAIPSQSASGGTTVPSLLGNAVMRDNTFTGLTAGVLVFALLEAIEITSNTVRNCRAGVWLVSPLDSYGFGLIAEPTVSFGLGMATGYPLPAGSEPAMHTVSAAPAPVRVYAGAANFKDSNGNVWTPDSKTAKVAVTKSKVKRPTQPAKIDGAQPASTDEALYQSERSAPDFTYTFSGLAQGYYTVTLKFAEITYTDAGNRLINASINSQRVIRQLDLVKTGGANTAEDEVFYAVPSKSGEIIVELSGDAAGKDGEAKISAIEIAPQWNSTQTGTANQQAGGLLRFVVEVGLLAQQGFVSLKPLPMEVRIEKNEIEGIASVGVLVLGDDTVQNGHTSSLVLNSNRVQVNPSQSFGIAQFATSDVQTAPAGGLAQTFATSIGTNPLLAAVVVFLVTRCVVTGNIIVNDAGKESRSLLLYDEDYASPTATDPPPEICVSANVLQGRMTVHPLRSAYLPASVPSPMNTWQFLNTVI